MAYVSAIGIHSSAPASRAWRVTERHTVVFAMNFDINLGFAVSCARNKNISFVYAVVCDELKKGKLAFTSSSSSARHERRLVFVLY